MMKNTLLLSIFCAGAVLSAQQAKAAATSPRIDERIYTTYSLDSAATTLSYQTCGTTRHGEGCFTSGTFGATFGKVGSILEGYPQGDLTTNTVTRTVYVLDIASGADKAGVTLYLFTKTDTVTPIIDIVTVTLMNTVPLPLTGGLDTTAFMAANYRFLFIGTDKGPHGIEMNKSTLQPVLTGNFSPPINVSAITVDQYGYVAITYGTAAFSAGAQEVYGPEGALRQASGPAGFTVGTGQGVLPSYVP